MMEPLTVLHEDNHVIAVFKPHGAVMEDLLESVRLYLKNKYQKPGNVFVGLVHRLDRPVAGVVVFARTSKGASRLSEAFRSRKTEKIYHARVEGETPAAGRLEHHHRLADGAPEIFREPREGTKPAVLEFRRLGIEGGTSLLEIRLHTGRKHQIRLQLAAAGHPILGDARYGASLPYRMGAIALVAKRLVVPHPTREETLVLETPP